MGQVEIRQARARLQVCVEIKARSSTARELFPPTAPQPGRELPVRMNAPHGTFGQPLYKPPWSLRARRLVLFDQKQSRGRGQWQSARAVRFWWRRVAAPNYSLLATPGLPVEIPTSAK